MNEQYAKCIPFDANVKGRIGGNPPQIVENSIPDGYLFMQHWCIRRKKTGCCLFLYMVILTHYCRITFIH